MSTDVVDATPVHLDKRCWSTGDTPNMARRQRGQPAADLVVPSAVGGAQQRLEADLLLAADRTMHGMRRRARTQRPTSLIRRLQLDTATTALEVNPAAVNDLLAEVLPTVVGDQLIGIPGLRPYPGRDHLDLCLLGDGAVVRLLGVSRQRWRSVADKLMAVGVPAWHTARNRLHAREASTRRDEYSPALLSGLLRRLPLWRGAAWVSVVAVGDSLEVYWRGGPGSEAIAAILADSCCRIPDVSAVAYPVSASVRGMALSDVQVGAVRGGEPEWAWFEWVATTAPGPALLDVAAYAVREVSAVVLPQIWEQHEMRRALACRDIGVVYGLLLRHGVGREQIAEFSGLSCSDVAEIIEGRRVEDYDVLCRIAEGLGVPRGYMGLAYDETQVATVEGCGCDERVKRRRFLSHAALVTVGSAVLGSSSDVWGLCGDNRCRRAVPA